MLGGTAKNNNKNKYLEQEKSWHQGGKKSHPQKKRARLKIEEEQDINELVFNLQYYAHFMILERFI